MVVVRAEPDACLPVRLAGMCANMYVCGGGGGSLGVKADATVRDMRRASRVAVSKSKPSVRDNHSLRRLSK